MVLATSLYTAVLIKQGKNLGCIGFQGKLTVKADSQLKDEFVLEWSYQHPRK